MNGSSSRAPSAKKSVCFPALKSGNVCTLRFRYAQDIAAFEQLFAPQPSDFRPQIPVNKDLLVCGTGLAKQLLLEKFP